MIEPNYRTLLVDRSDGVATITLNRPEKLNAFDTVMSAEFAEALTTLDADDDVRAIVVTGAGKAFCAGADVSGSRPPGSDSDGDEESSAPRRRAGPPELRPWELRTPIIAAINGAAVGMGLTYPMMWDIRIAAADAKLGFVFTRRGLVPEGNASWLLSRVIGLSAALELLITGRIFSGEEAQRLGVVHRAVPRDEVLQEALAVARDIATNTAPAAVALTKRMVYRYAQDTDRWAARREELELFDWARRQPDAVEGVASFIEKRTPEWSRSSNDDLPDGWR